MKLVKLGPTNVYTTWHRFSVLGRGLLADFETDAGGHVRLRRGFRSECTVRGPDAGAAFERLLPVISSAAVEALTPTTRSKISAIYLGVGSEPLGDELVAGVYWTGLKLHAEVPLLSDVGYGLESTVGFLRQNWSARPL